MRILVIILLFTFFSCQKKKEIIPVDHFYDIKVERLKLEKLDECKGEAIEEAEKFVDALIDKWIKEQNNNADDFPLKPKRPSTPGKIIGTQKSESN